MKESLRINDMFWTFQGEGSNAGTRALFVRLPFCNLQCSWCDTSYNTFLKMSIEDFKARATEEKSRFAVITGGEPTMNADLPMVVKLLKELGFRLAIESNGMGPVPEEIDFVTISPKRESGYNIFQPNLARINDLKVVVDEGFVWAVLDDLEGLLSPFYETNLYLSPEYGQMKKSVDMISSYIKEHPQWKLNLQTHKWIGVP